MRTRLKRRYNEINRKKEIHFSDCVPRFLQEMPEVKKSHLDEPIITKVKNVDDLPEIDDWGDEIDDLPEIDDWGDEIDNLPEIITDDDWDWGDVDTSLDKEIIWK